MGFELIFTGHWRLSLQSTTSLCTAKENSIHCGLTNDERNVLSRLLVLTRKNEHMWFYLTFVANSKSEK